MEDPVLIHPDDFFAMIDNGHLCDRAELVKTDGKPRFADVVYVGRTAYRLSVDADRITDRFRDIETVTLVPRGKVIGTIKIDSGNGAAWNRTKKRENP